MKIVDYLMIGATIRISREILCLQYAGFFSVGLVKLTVDHIKFREDNYVAR